MNYITPQNLSDYAFLNEDTLVRPLRGICVCFHGYTDATMFSESPIQAKLLGERGIAWVFPYYSVWAWMSRSSQLFNEQVIDAVYEKLGADEHIPLIISGGSMGGLTALNYLVYGKRPAAACAVNCPVTDVSAIFRDHPNVRRAILSAHIEEDGELDEILRHDSPVSFAKQLPNIPYYFIYGEKDVYFTKTQRPPMMEALDAAGIAYTAVIQPEMQHCDLDSHPDARDAFCNFIADAVK